RLLDDRRTRLMAVARGLPSRPEDLLALPQQRLDLASSRLGSALQRNASVHEQRLTRVSARLSPAILHRPIERRSDRLAALDMRFKPAVERRLQRDGERLAALSRALNNLDPSRPKPGFARVEDTDGKWITSAHTLSEGQQVALVFGDGRRKAVIGQAGSETPPPAPQSKPAAKPAPRPKTPPAGQGSLF
uniref:exodeoxyribonuclease VII large subunit n=1 Tax=unclassified Brevundimonas TaxID=2622653 RepID=UPI0025BE057A